jgi:hypothetical protein
VYHPILRWVVPVVLLVVIVAVLVDHSRRAAASRTHPHHPVHEGRNHITAAGVLAIVLIVSFIGSFLIP